MLQLAQQELQRLSHIATSTLQFNRHKLLPAPTDVADVMQSVLDLYSGRFRQAGIDAVSERKGGACRSARKGPVCASIISTHNHGVWEGNGMARAHQTEQRIGLAVATTLTVNGSMQTLQVEPWTSLLDLLREKLQLTGSKKGCDHGQCGACTVLVNEVRVNSCLCLAVMHDGDTITTIEGLGSEGNLSPMQQAFVDHDGYQCGYCTPGQICSAVGMLKEGHAKTEADVREQLSGNVCRCGAYPNIVAAVRHVMATSQAEGAK